MKYQNAKDKYPETVRAIEDEITLLAEHESLTNDELVKVRAKIKYHKKLLQKLAEESITESQCLVYLAMEKEEIELESNDNT